MKKLIFLVAVFGCLSGYGQKKNRVNKVVNVDSAQIRYRGGFNGMLHMDTVLYRTVYDTVKVIMLMDFSDMLSDGKAITTTMRGWVVYRYNVPSLGTRKWIVCFFDYDREHILFKDQVFAFKELGADPLTTIHF